MKKYNGNIKKIGLILTSFILFFQSLLGTTLASDYSTTTTNQNNKNVLVLDRQTLNKLSNFIWSNNDIKNKIIKACKATPGCWTNDGNISLDKIFGYSKTVEKDNGDLTSILTPEDALDLIKNVDKYGFSYCEGISPAYSYGTVVLLKLAKLNPNINIELTEKDKKGILCQYVLRNKDKYIYNYGVKTYSRPYRQRNIKKGFETFDGIIVGPNQVFDLLDHINTRIDYEDGLAIVNGEEKPVPGGGLCGVATAMFQSLSQIKGIDWIKRRSHTEWFYSLYGKKIGWDATIFSTMTKDGRHIKLVNLVWKNKTNGYLKLNPWTKLEGKKFITGIKVYSTIPIKQLIIKNTKLKQGPVYKDKDGNEVKDKKGNILYWQYNKIYAIDPETNKVVWSFNNRYKKIGR